MSHRRLRSIRRAAGSRQVEQEQQQEQTKHRQRELLQGETQNALVMHGLIDGCRLTAWLVQELINHDHGTIASPQTTETVQETLDALGLGERGYQPKKQLHDLAPA